MFNVVKDPVFTRTVTILVPEGDGTVEETMDVTFRSLPDEESANLNWNALDDVKAFLGKVIVDIDDLVGENNQPIKFDQDVLAMILARPYVRVALLKQYSRSNIEAITGN